MAVSGIWIGAFPVNALAKDYVKLGQVGFAQWRCYAWASLSEQQQPNAGELFTEGYEKLKELIGDAIKGNVAKEDFQKIPIGISWNLTGGPTLDFRLGVMWANILESERNDLMPPAKEGFSFADRLEIRKLDAANKFMAGNCHLL